MVLPIGDDNWDRRRAPVVTTILVVVNVLVFLYEINLIGGGGERALQAFIYAYGVVPLEYATGQDLPPTTPGPYWITLFSSMFLHGGWGHLLGNMLFLWIFGDNVEDRFGRGLFVLFYLAAGVVGSFAQILVDPRETIPAVGASGAISGVLGAYMVMFPAKRVRVLLFYFITEVPAVIMIGFWAFTQFVNGFGSLAVTEETNGGGVAYMAHIGGFVAGLIGGMLLRAVRPPSRRRPLPRYDW